MPATIALSPERGITRDLASRGGGR
jgi:hypothetical protein